MLKGFCSLLHVAVVLAVPGELVAQVYRCETPSGVTYSDMPCGASAEEIVVAGDVLDTRGVGASDSVQAIAPVQAGERPVPEGGRQPVDAGQDLNGFLAMLRSQRQEQIDQLDSQLATLRQRAGSAEFLEMEVSEQDRINGQIAQLESDRASILAEYDALITEAERRLD